MLYCYGNKIENVIHLEFEIIKTRVIHVLYVA